MSFNAVVLEYQIHSHTGKPYKEQIFEDGTYGIWSDIDTQVGPEGLVQKQLDTPRWRLYTTLSPERMGRLKEAIKKSGFFELEAEYKPVNEVKDGGAKTVWYAQIDAATHQVEILNGVEVPQINELKMAMNVITQEALDEAHE